MKDTFSISLAQLNFIVGDIEGNYKKICNAYEAAMKKGSSLLITPELSLIGYPPEDIIFKESLVSKANFYRSMLTNLTRNKGCAVILGSLFNNKNKLYNTAFFLADGKTIGIITKHHLPNYGIFDEKRIFSQGELASPILYKGFKFGILICEDAWLPEVPEKLSKRYSQIMISINASPFEKSKFTTRMEIAKNNCKKYKSSYIYLNNVGGQDSIILDGGSFILNNEGETVAQAKFFSEEILHVNAKLLNKKIVFAHKKIAKKLPSAEELTYRAIMLGIRDYIKKNAYKKIIIGLSGGIDSALITVLATDALGAENVHAVMMTSRYTSRKSIKDANLLAKKLGINYEILSIENIFNSTQSTLNKDKLKNITLENMQSRIRGLLLMSLSNELGELLLNTGNKSESSVGYTTLYGDSCGAYAPIKDLYKTEIYVIAKWRNNHLPESALGTTGPIIHDSILIKAPSAELSDNQTDQDNLPPYEVLDPILYHLIEENLSQEDIVKKGFNKKTVAKIIKMLYSSEFKRRQSPPGAKISSMCFNIDRRYPITNKFTEQQCKQK